MSAWVPYGFIRVPEVDTHSPWWHDTMAARAADAAKGVKIITVNAAVKAPVRLKAKRVRPRKVIAPKTPKVWAIVDESRSTCGECDATLHKDNKMGLCRIHSRGLYAKRQREHAKRLQG